MAPSQCLVSSMCVSITAPTMNRKQAQPQLKCQDMWPNLTSAPQDSCLIHPPKIWLVLHLLILRLLSKPDSGWPWSALHLVHGLLFKLCHVSDIYSLASFTSSRQSRLHTCAALLHDVNAICYQILSADIPGQPGIMHGLSLTLKGIVFPFLFFC